MNLFVHNGIQFKALVLCLLVAGALQSAKPFDAQAASTPPASLQAQVSQANKLANEEKYLEAIPLYEKIVKQAPQETQLKRNLSALYFNQGMTYQNQKKYAEANAYFDKVLGLYPSEPQATKAKAGSHFYEAMDLRDADAPQYDRIMDLLNKAMALDPNEASFRKGTASVLMRQAREMAEREEYEASAETLNKALTFDPKSATIRQSLANVYLGLANKATGDPAQRKKWTDKALEAEDTPTMRANVQSILNPPTANDSEEKKGFPRFSLPKGGNGAAPKQMATLSVHEMLGDIEKELGLVPDPKTPLKDRLEAAEVKVDGKAGAGSLNNRAKALYTTLFGKRDLTANADPSLAQAPVETSANTYLEDIFKVTEGKVIRWQKFPLRVHIEDESKNPRFKPEYVEAVKRGLDLWKTQTNGFISYVVVKNEDAADITIGFEDAYNDRFAGTEESDLEFYKKYKVSKPSPLLRVLNVASMVTPGYFSLAPQVAGAALQYGQMKQMQALIDESKIKLGLALTDGLPPEKAAQLVQNQAAHEFGHVLGLKGHSPQEGDLMSPILKVDAPERPSRRDIETLRQLYNRPANIVLNVR